MGKRGILLKPSFSLLSFEMKEVSEKENPEAAEPTYDKKFYLKLNALK